MPRSKNQPVSSFAPSIINALRKGATEPVVVKGDPTVLYSLMNVLRTCRRAMQKEQHPDWEVCQQAQITLQTAEGQPVVPDGRTKKLTRIPAQLTISPRGTQFASLLGDAGISLEREEGEEVASPSLLPTLLPPPPEDDPEAALQELLNEDK